MQVSAHGTNEILFGFPLDRIVIGDLDGQVISSANAPTFSVLQRSLEQTITLAQLQEASMHVPTIARADCIRIHKLLAGIFISRLSRPEALAFQRGLTSQGHETDVTEDSLLPPMPSGMRSMRVSRTDRELHFRDFMDRVTIIPLDEVLFVAAACIEDTGLKRHTTTKRVDIGRGVHMNVDESHLRETPERSVRIDVFFSLAPHRFSLSAADSTRFFVQDQPIYLRKPEMIAWAFQKVRSWAPAECRLNRHIHHEQPLGSRVATIAYEEEIRWRFYRLRE